MHDKCIFFYIITRRLCNYCIYLFNFIENLFLEIHIPAGKFVRWNVAIRWISFEVSRIELMSYLKCTLKWILVQT